MGKMLKMVKFSLMALGMAAFASNAQAAYTDDCITFSSAESFTLKTANASKNWDGTLWTSTDKTNWTKWNGVTIVSAAKTGGTYHLYVRGNTSNTAITGYDSSYGHRCRWVLTGRNIACTGNVETLRGATGNNPSSTEMASFCYRAMFYGCTSLTAAPTLPATTLAYYCYEGMFEGCTSLTKAPALPATTLAGGCYCAMFSGCTSLTDAPALPATTLADNCYGAMFSGCTALTSAPVLSATTLAQYCYSSMFSGCTSLTNAPALPAMTLADYCYEYMFYGCTSLTDAPALPATNLAYDCYGAMFNGCTSLASAPALLATTMSDCCYKSMFEGCTSLKVAPALPATTLADYCYFSMFKDCTALEVNTAAPGKEWKIPVASTTATDWGADMFAGTAGTLQGQPTLNTTYYISSALPKPGSDGNPWQIGAGAGDAVNAWTNGTGTLVVEGVGKMKSFASDGSDVPWPTGEVAAVEISGEVVTIGQNAWHGLGDGVTYNGLSATAAKTMCDGFGGTAEYGRVAFKEFQVDGGSVQSTVALETAKSLTNEWAEVELTDDDVRVENGRIVITHETDPQTQGFYFVQPTK